VFPKHHVTSHQNKNPSDRDNKRKLKYKHHYVVYPRLWRDICMFSYFVPFFPLSFLSSSWNAIIQHVLTAAFNKLLSDVSSSKNVSLKAVFIVFMK
jgi:hypothetical protein